MKKVLGKLIGAAGENYGRIANTTVRSVTRGTYPKHIGGYWHGGGRNSLCRLMHCDLRYIVDCANWCFPGVDWGGSIYMDNRRYAYSQSFNRMDIEGVSDNILKPFLLGKSEVPMPIGFVGSIGGFLFSGFIGLFTGAIVLALFYKLFNVWLETPNK
jgi:hypothetical protein